jgi:hypothetical protein
MCAAWLLSSCSNLVHSYPADYNSLSLDGQRTAESLAEVLLLTVHSTTPSATTCTWTLLRDRSRASFARASLYPWPFVSFAAAARISPATVVLFGGVIRPHNFAFAGSMNSQSNIFSLVVPINVSDASFSWSVETPKASSISRTIFPPPRGTIGTALTTFDNLLFIFGGFSSYVSACTIRLMATGILGPTQIGYVWSGAAPLFTPTCVLQAAAISIPARDSNNNAGSVLYIGGEPASRFTQDPLGAKMQSWLNVHLSDTWILVASDPRTVFTPLARWAHTVVYFADLEMAMLVMFGGYIAHPVTGTISATAELWFGWLTQESSVIYWLPALPASMNRSAAQLNQSLTGILDVGLNFSSAIAAGEWPPARAQHTAVAVGQYFVIFGGFVAAANGSALNDVWVLDVALAMAGNITWTRVRPLKNTPWPSPRGGHIAAQLDEALCVSDDYVPGTSPNDILSPKHGMILFGGAQSSLSDPMDSGVYLLRVLRVRDTGVLVGQWSRCFSGPSARINAAAAPLSDRGLVLTGGVDSSGNPVPDSWLLVPIAGWVRLNSVNSLPSIVYHSMAVFPVVNSPTVLVLGGISNSSLFTPDGRTPFQSYQITLACPVGTLTSSTGICLPCPIGTFMDLTGQSACTACGLGILTASAGATSVGACSICDKDACHGHGTCAVNVSSQSFSCSCTGAYTGSEINNCNTPVLGLILGFVIPTIVLATASLLFWRNHVKKWQKQNKRLNLLLEESDEQGVVCVCVCVVCE